MQELMNLKEMFKVANLRTLRTLKDKRKVQSVSRVLHEIARGEKVSNGRITRTQEFLVSLLNEVNARATYDPIPPELQGLIKKR